MKKMKLDSYLKLHNKVNSKWIKKKKVKKNYAGKNFPGSPVIRNIHLAMQGCWFHLDPGTNIPLATKQLSSFATTNEAQVLEPSSCNY